MGRRSKYEFTLSDGRRVGFTPKPRGGMFRVVFPDPAERGKYVEAATGVPIPKGWTAGKRPPADFDNAAAVVILKHYSPTLPPDAKKVTWGKALDAIATAHDFREKSLETYRSIVRVLREHAPESKGPFDITPEVAKRFRTEYGKGTFTRSKRSDAKRYKRSAKTVENAIRRLSGLWNHLNELGYAKGNPWDGISRPKVPKKEVRIPSEEEVKQFTDWLRQRYPEWELIHLFLTVKSLTGRRTRDLCHVESSQLDARAGTLTITPTQDKTHRELTFPLPADIVKALDRIKGPKYLWERYAADAKVYRPGARNRDSFAPMTLFWCVCDIFQDYGTAHPDRPRITAHDLRRRAITLTVAATQSIDATAHAIGIDPTTARRYYLDAQKAFDRAELMMKMAGVLRPQP